MWKDLLRLTRLPNLFTAVADIFAGHFIATRLAESTNTWTHASDNVLSHLILLSLASGCLYAAGAALNDLVDLAHDRRHNPKRPLPAGRVQPIHAAILIGVLFVAGLLLAQLVSMGATINALAIILLIVAYDGYSKRLAKIGPINMALVRAFNVLLGMQILPTTAITFPQYLVPPAIMFVYIAILTFISLSEEVSPRIKSTVKYLVIGIVFVDAAMLTAYGLFLPSCLTLLLVIPPVALSRRFYIS